MANLESFKLDSPYSKIGHCRLETYKLDTLNHEIGHPMHFKIGHGKLKTFILDTLDLKHIRHGKPKICQIEHLRPQIGHVKTQFHKLDTLYLEIRHGKFRVI
jgi:hypothetical protein